MKNQGIISKNLPEDGSERFLVGEGGFGPPKSKTTDLQSAPFLAAREFPLIRLSLSVTEMKRLSKTGGAGEGSRTPNLLITNQLLCH